MSNFAVNDNYRINHPEILEIGKTVFLHFILPYVDFMKSIVGVKALYIYALPEDRLIEHYKKFGFQRLSKDEEKFVGEILGRIEIVTIDEIEKLIKKYGGEI